MVDPPLPPAADPWHGSAPVPPPPTTPLPMPMPPTLPLPPTAAAPPLPVPTPVPPPPQVIVVEVRRRRRWPWVLGVFAVLSLICCGACAVITAPLRGEYPSRIAATPSTVAGFERDDNGLVRLIAEETKFRIRASEYVDDSFADRFVDPRTASRSVIAFGGTGLIWDPAGTLKSVIQGAGPDLRNVADYSAGRLGGLLKCGDGKDDKKQAVVLCAWIDHGSMGVGVFYGKPSHAEAAAFLRTLREAVIIRP
ncbi:hypothetical protein AB0M47_19340 [Hamadaea sp. NPDC051192]|uniref:hypothetical protein n=1 Tax=Hamadaea sp. NPDC051192 TaxID=3154940 RepID=UPI003415FF58